MTEKLNIKQILSDDSLIQKILTVQGWVRTRRDSKAGISFIALSDGSCFDSLQLVIPNTLPNYESDVLRLTTGCAITAKGQLIKSEGKNQAVELKVETLEVIGWVSDPESYPMAAKRHTMEHLREYTHLRARTNIIGAVSRVRNTVAQAIHQFFNDRGFFWINTPILTAEDCEGAGELFTVSAFDFLQLPKTPEGHVDFSKDFFGRQTYLTVSGQLNAEAYCLALSKVYTFGPTFRAENSNTSRHLAEFWMVEPEIAFANLNDVIELAQALIKFICKTILEKNPDDMAFFSKWVDKTCIERLKEILEKDFAVINYSEAIELLKKSNRHFEYEVAWGIDLQSEHERYLCEELFRKPVVVINYPKGIKAFYMRLNEDDKTVAAMDVLLPGVGEIIGGSQREERYDFLIKRIKECGLNPKDYEWYLDLRRYGSVPHAGFGLGFERFIRYITGVSNVRDVIPFARTPQYIPPAKNT